MIEKYTPGPWTFDTDIRGPNGEAIGSGDWEGGLSPSEGDGRLIEAAPDLLEALIDAMEWVDDNAHTTHDFSKARAAIAKATGEKS